jgi:ATP-dependent Zn protease
VGGKGMMREEAADKLINQLLTEMDGSGVCVYMDNECGV